jgi:hypothetical protein
MTQDEIIDLATEAGLAYNHDDYPDIWDTYMNVGREEIMVFAKLIAAKAIAELESQEPVAVAWRTFDGEGGYEYRAYEENESYADDWNKRNPNHKGWVDPLYTAPSQRTWVNLTRTQIQNVYFEILKEHCGGHQMQGQLAFGEALQAKIKEKNT